MNLNTAVQRSEKGNTFYGSFKGELIYVLFTETLLVGAIWKTWFSIWFTVLYAASGIGLLVLFWWAHGENTEERYEFVGKTAFAIFLLDSLLTLIRLK